ncbi:MAG: hypothetical protein ABR968_03675 [Bacteroidales bacterium]|jgi:hypothetical protein
MATVYDLKNDKHRIDTCQRTLKDCVWANVLIEDVEHDPNKRIIFNDYKKILIGTDEWWDAIEKGVIKTNEYLGKFVKYTSLKSSSGITLVTEINNEKSHWPVDYLSVYNDIQGKFVRILFVSYTHTTKPSHSNLYNSIIGNLPLSSNESPSKFILKIEVEE